VAESPSIAGTKRTVFPVIAGVNCALQVGTFCVHPTTVKSNKRADRKADFFIEVGFGKEKGTVEPNLKVSSVFKDYLDFCQ
jgi:hypothetical protein